MAVDSPENKQDIESYIDAQVRDMTIAAQMGSLGAIMGAKRPLSLQALHALHGGSQEMTPEHLLQRFGSVLLGLNGEGETIQVLPLSFREFITDRANINNSQLTQKFYISEKAYSGQLARLCLQTMVREITSAGISTEFGSSCSIYLSFPMARAIEGD
ncbi:hypothetical protein FIBSPDRAFT_959599 [Athelia psychrophila]|uniref:Uncharacterized protein n=1 Tax=Athelia psychrophila TaxID=1759441 RepID=A0A166DAV1_9AGAM|nr:hypothetical protein FIBSPDRAFT_959599 [Fibularhizoctonia sp. CBS 109695]